MTCFTYKQFFVKNLHWMIEFCSENVIFLITKFLFYLLKDILNLATFFSFLVTSFCDILFVFQDFLGISFFYILYAVLDFLCSLFFDVFFIFWIFLVPCCLMLYFTLWIFMVSTSFICLHLKIFQIPCFLICNIWCSVFHDFLWIPFYTSISLELSFLFLALIFSLFKFQVSLLLCWKLLLVQ